MVANSPWGSHAKVKIPDGENFDHHRPLFLPRAPLVRSIPPMVLLPCSGAAASAAAAFVADTGAIGSHARRLTLDSGPEF